MGDEDERFLNSGAIISVYHNIDDVANPVAVKRLTVDIAKKDITMLTYEMLKTSDYCYGKDKDDLVVTRITSGLKEKDIKLGDLRYNIYYAQTESGTFNKITSGFTYNELTGDNGYVEIEFYAINAGYYKIEATLSNSNVAPIMTDAIHITENPIVTSVRFEKYDMDDPFNRDKTTEILPQNAANSYFGTVRDNKSETHRIVYYHDYTDTDSRKISSEYIPTVEEVKIVAETKPSYLTIVPSTVNGRELSEDKEVGAGKLKCEYLNALINKANHSNYGETEFQLVIEQTIGGQKIISSPLTVDLTVARQANISKVELYKANTTGWSESDKATIADMFYYTTDETITQGYNTYTAGNLTYSVFRITYRDSDGDRVPVGYDDIALYTAQLTIKPIWVSSDEYEFDGYGGFDAKALNESNSASGYSEATSGTATHIGIALEDLTMKPNQIWVFVGQNEKTGVKLNIHYVNNAKSINIPQMAYEEAKMMNENQLSIDNNLNNDDVINSKPINNVITNTQSNEIKEPIVTNNSNDQSTENELVNNTNTSDEPLVPEEGNTIEPNEPIINDENTTTTKNELETNDIDDIEDLENIV